MRLPGRVAAVGHGHVADTKVIEHAQCAQAAVDGVAALQSDKTSYSTFTEGVHDTCTGNSH